MLYPPPLLQKFIIFSRRHNNLLDGLNFILITPHVRERLRGRRLHPLGRSDQVSLPQHYLRLMEVAYTDEARAAVPLSREGRDCRGYIRREVAAFTRL